MLFFTTETKEKVEIGINFFKSSLPYNFVDGVTKFIFFSDKDFDYIDVYIIIRTGNLVVSVGFLLIGRIYQQMVQMTPKQ